MGLADAGRYGSATVSRTAAKRGQRHPKGCPYHSVPPPEVMASGVVISGRSELGHSVFAVRHDLDGVNNAILTRVSVQAPAR
jgi:hypothetical protein